MKAKVSSGPARFTQQVRSKTQPPALQSNVVNSRQRYSREKDPTVSSTEACRCQKSFEAHRSQQSV